VGAGAIVVDVGVMVGVNTDRGVGVPVAPGVDGRAVVTAAAAVLAGGVGVSVIPGGSSV
jgi:hypothetical protein